MYGSWAAEGRERVDTDQACVPMHPNGVHAANCLTCGKRAPPACGLCVHCVCMLTTRMCKCADARLSSCASSSKFFAAGRLSLAGCSSLSMGMSCAFVSFIVVFVEHHRM